MIKFQATALVHSISPVIQATERFQKRELILDDSWDKEGKHYANFMLVEFSGDRMAQLDNYYPGQRVTVECCINGKEWNNRIITTIRGLSIASFQQQQQYAPAQAPMPGAYPQPQQPQYQQQPQSQYAPAPAPMPGGYPQQPTAPAYPQQPQQPQYAAPAPVSAPIGAPQPQQPYGQHHSPGVSELPFPTDGRQSY